MDKKALAGKIDKHAISVLANLHCDKNQIVSSLQYLSVQFRADSQSLLPPKKSQFS